MTQIVWAIKNGELDTVKKLTSQSDFKVNEYIEAGRSSLHYAADYGQAAIVEYLVQIGADTNQLDKHGISPLLAAIYENHVDCARLLLAHGAKKDAKAPNGSAYIDCAESLEMQALLKA